jgi:hypothetical protein
MHDTAYRLFVWDINMGVGRIHSVTEFRMCIYRIRNNMNMLKTKSFKNVIDIPGLVDKN